MIKHIDALIEQYWQEIVDIRRDIHAHPELSYHEVRTSALVADKLRALGLTPQENVGGYGVTATIDGYEPGDVILLRADMDALPIFEETDLSFKSQNSGVMHACGHDVHTATLLGVAMILVKLKDYFSGTVKLCFQPAEEGNPTGGAQYMIDDGVLENPKVNAAMALHVWNKLPVGTVSLKSGVMMAQSNRLYIKIRGKASHGSAPEEGIDAIACAGELISSLQTIVSRNVGALDSAVVTISKINGGIRYNVLAEKVDMEGTVRIFDDSLDEYVPRRIKEICAGIAMAFGCDIEVDYVKGYQTTVNDPELTALMTDAFKTTIGDQNVIIADNPAAGGEDFSAFTKHVPSVYFWAGMESDKNRGATILHSPHLNVDEDVMKTGIKCLISGAIRYLNRKHG